MSRSGHRKQPRYLEVSWRNRVSRIFIGSGSVCNPTPVCGDVCVTIKRAGDGRCRPKVEHDPCSCQPIVVPACDLTVSQVCALEIDSEGWAVFEWPKELLKLKQGWYEAHIHTGDCSCSSCGVLPLRIGPHCNVIEVETNPKGPDCLGWVLGCDDDCDDDICPPQTGSTSTSKTVTYQPNWRT